MKSNFFSVVLVVLTFAVCSPFNMLHSQNIDLANASQPDFVKHFAIGTISTNLITVGVDGYLGGALFWESCVVVGAACPTFDPVPTSRTLLTAGFEIQLIGATPSSVRISSVVPHVPEAETTILLRVKEGMGGTFRTKAFRIIGREPLEMVFVLDISGSMECEPSDNVSATWDGCVTASPDRRWDKLKNAVNQFMTKMNDGNHILTGASGDLFSVAYFSGTNTNPANGFIALPGTRFINFNNFRTGINGDMTAREAGAAPVLMRDGTSIGTGFDQAINQRFGGATNSAKRQVIVLLSDGEENRDPKIYIDMTGKKVRNGPGGPILVDFNSFTGIEVFSIGFGASLASLPPLLQSIASTSDNVFYTLTGQETTFLDEISTYAFNDIFNAFSPNLIRFEDQKLTTQNSANFVCNDNVPRLFFEATFEKAAARDYIYRLSRDGQAIDSFDLSIGDYYATLTLKTERLADTKSSGIWTLTCTSATGNSTSFGTNVHLSATADDHALEIKCEAGQPSFKVGDKMTPTVRLSYNGSPVTSANVSAVLVRPGDDLGDLLARANIPSLPPGHTEEGGCDERRYAYLEQNNPAALAALKQLKRDTILLNHIGNGVYKGEFDNLDVTGVYKLYYHARSTMAGLGEIERMKVQTTYVRFGSIDYAQGGNKKGKITFNSDNLSTWNFRPTYQNNQNETKYVGPGLSQFINVEGRTGSYIEITDNCDGSYQLNFFAKPNDNIKITMLDEEVFKGKAVELNNPYAAKHFGLSFHTGLTLPLEKLDLLYNSNFYLEGDVSYRFLPNFSAEIVGGHYRFKDNFYINGLSLYGKGHFTITQLLEGFVGAGAGAYQPKGEDWGSGFSLRTGLMYRLDNHWAAMLDAGYFNATTPKYSFATLGLGIKYLF